MAAETGKILQPIDPEFEHKLDPEYVRFHKANLLYRPRIDKIPWSPAIRDKPPPVITTSDPLHVGSTVDYSLNRCKVRVFTPEGEPPSADGWPVFLFIHGGERRGTSAVSRNLTFAVAGGWALGNISTENSFSTNMCKRRWSSRQIRVYLMSCIRGKLRRRFC